MLINQPIFLLRRFVSFTEPRPNIWSTLNSNLAIDIRPECLCAMSKRISRPHRKSSVKSFKRQNAGASARTPTTMIPITMKYPPMRLSIANPSNHFISTLAFWSLAAPGSSAKSCSRSCWGRATHCNAFMFCCDRSVDSAAKKDTMNSSKIR